MTRGSDEAGAIHSNAVELDDAIPITPVFSESTMSHTLRETAEDLTRLLSETKPAESVTAIRVTRKGGAPAQTVKRLFLSRIASIPTIQRLGRVRGDTYKCQVDAFAVHFRLAVTASRHTLPWFNSSISELTSLESRDTLLTVLWNPSTEDDWCSTIRAFFLPPDEMLEQIRESEVAITRSLIETAARKILQSEDSFHCASLHQLAPLLSRIRDSTLRDDEILEARDALHSALTDCHVSLNHSSPLKPVGDNRRFVGKLRERLSAILMRIHVPPHPDSPFLLKHDKSDSLILSFGAELTAPLTLGPFEISILRGAYGDGVEEEQSPEGSEPIEHPYDPTKTVIDTRPITIDLLMRRVQHEEIDLNPPFQRKAGLWSRKQKSQLIESLLIRIPLPSFYFDATEDSNWLVVDGLQRLVAFRDFILDNMPLDGLEYLTQYNGRTFEELPRHLRRAIEESQVTVNLIQPGTPAEVKFNIFRRVNTGGLILTAQEIRHALNQGPAVDLLRELAQCQEFLDATTGSIPTERMADCEFVLRFLAFNIVPYTEYRSPDMDSFLSTQMGRLNSMRADYGELTRRFKRAMVRTAGIFGKHAFRKQYELQQPRSPINKALFEAWSVCLGRLPEDVAAILVGHRDDVVNRAILLNQSPDFNNAISVGTADVSKVHRRFSAVDALVQNIINGASPC